MKSRVLTGDKDGIGTTLCSGKFKTYLVVCINDI